MGKIEGKNAQKNYYAKFCKLASSLWIIIYIYLKTPPKVVKIELVNST